MYVCVCMYVRTYNQRLAKIWWTQRRSCFKIINKPPLNLLIGSVKAKTSATTLVQTMKKLMARDA